jgi:hypothetical protein
MSDCNCCSCAYSTPPWWVTMGFVPSIGQRPTIVQQPSFPIGQQNPGTPSSPSPGGLLGPVFGGTTGATGQQSSSGSVLHTVGTVVGDVLNPLGALLSLL